MTGSALFHIHIRDNPSIPASYTAKASGPDGLVDYRVFVWPDPGASDLNDLLGRLSCDLAKSPLLRAWPEEVAKWHQAIGKELFQRFLPQAIEAWIDDQQPPPAPRIALELPDALETLPWELLFHEPIGHIAQSGSVFRISPGIATPPAVGHLQVCYTQDLDVPDQVPLLVVTDAFRVLLRKSLSSIDFTQNEDPDNSHVDIAKAREQFSRTTPNVFIFTGHGQVSTDGNGVHCDLVVRDGDSQRKDSQRKLDVDALAELLKLGRGDYQRLQLAIFNACNTAGYGDDPSLSNQLQRRFAQNFTAWSMLTVGMQTKMAIHTAQLLTASLYCQFAAEAHYLEPLSHFDLMLATIRQRIAQPMKNFDPDLKQLLLELERDAAEFERAKLQWWVPVLYAVSPTDTQIAIKGKDSDDPPRGPFAKLRQAVSDIRREIPRIHTG